MDGRQRMQSWILAAVAVCVLIALATSVFHVWHAVSWTSPVPLAAAMALAVVAMNLAFVGLRVLFPEPGARPWIWTGLLVATTVELLANYLVGGLYAQDRVPDGVGELTGLEPLARARAAAIFFGLAAPILGGIGVTFLAEAASRIFSPRPMTESQYAQQILREEALAK